MNPHGIVVTENTNHILTVNEHSYEDPAHQTENTNFALLVAKHFSEPFRGSNGYGESIARLSNCWEAASRIPCPCFRQRDLRSTADCGGDITDAGKEK